MTTGEQRKLATRWINDFAQREAPEREHLHPGDRLRLIENGEELEIIAHGPRRQIPPWWMVAIAAAGAALAWWVVL